MEQDEPNSIDSNDTSDSYDSNNNSDSNDERESLTSSIEVEQTNNIPLTASMDIPLTANQLYHQFILTSSMNMPLVDQPNNNSTLRPVMHKYNKSNVAVRAPKQKTSVRKAMTEPHSQGRVYRITFDLSGEKFSNTQLGDLIVSYTGSTSTDGNVRLTNHFSKAKSLAAKGKKGNTLQSLINTVANILALSAVREHELSPTKMLWRPTKIEKFYKHEILHEMGILDFEIVETYYDITKRELAKREHECLKNQFTCLNDKRPLDGVLINWDKVKVNYPHEHEKRQKILDFIEHDHGNCLKN
jgi:hypothetical protein